MKNKFKYMIIIALIDPKFKKSKNYNYYTFYEDKQYLKGLTTHNVFWDLKGEKFKNGELIIPFNSKKDAIQFLKKYPLIEFFEKPFKYKIIKFEISYKIIEDEYAIPNLLKIFKDNEY